MRPVIGPILKQYDGYAFDSWMPEQGVRRSYCYQRIEDAYYALKCTIAEAARGNRPVPLVCATSDEFTQSIGGSYFPA